MRINRALLPGFQTTAKQEYVLSKPITKAANALWRLFVAIAVVFRGFILKKSLTLLGKSGKVNKSKRDDENQYAHPSFFQRAVVWCKAAKRTALNTCPSGSAEMFSRRRRVRPILRLRSVGTG